MTREQMLGRAILAAVIATAFLVVNVWGILFFASLWTNSFDTFGAVVIGLIVVVGGVYCFAYLVGKTVFKALQRSNYDDE